MLIFLFFILFQLILADDKPLALVKITDGTFTVNQFNMEIYDKYLPFDKSLELNISGKILYASSLGRYFEIIEKYEGYYNSRWVLLVDKYQTMKQITEFIINKNPKNILTIIIDLSLSLNTYDLENIPIFIAENVDFARIQKYDIEKETANNFLKITYTNNRKIYPEKYLMIVSITLTILTILTAIYWHLSVFKFYRTQVSTLQKILSALPYIKAFLSPLIVYYVKYCNTNHYDPTSLLVIIYVDTVISALWAIYKTIFWFLAILVSSGWQIYKTELTRNELRKFVGIYIFIYFFVCFDKIIDIMADRVYWKFEVSELKNFVLYTLLSCYSVYNCKHCIQFLKEKFLYAKVLAPEYLPSLALKIKMVFFLAILISSYTIAYILMIFTQKYVFMIYSGDVFSMVNNNALDVVFLLINLPRRFPDFFNIDYQIEEYARTSIYNCKLPTLHKMANAKTCSADFGFLNANKKDKKKLVLDKNTPFVIINPIFNEDLRWGHSQSIINRSESADSGIALNFTDKISIGYLC